MTRAFRLMDRRFRLPGVGERTAPAPRAGRAARRRARGRRSRRRGGRSRAPCRRAHVARSRRAPPDAMTGIVRASRERHRAVDIEAGERAVARNVGVDDRGNARILEAPAEIERGDVRGLGPALDRDPAVARIDADRDPVREHSPRLAHEVGIAHRGGADDDATDARFQPAANRPHVAHPAAELHLRRQPGKNAPHRSTLTGLPAKAPSRSTTCR